MARFYHQLAKSFTNVPLNTLLPYTLICFSPHFLKGLISNDWYVTTCGFSDNNRLKTWMPYVVNRVPLCFFPSLLPFLSAFLCLLTDWDWACP